jgi:Cu(I)-responsive transcriptional regulator
VNFTIGRLAQATGVPSKTIRYYEETGLLPRPKRAGNGYRRYVERDVHLLRFVKRARDLGFSMDQVSSLLTLWNDRRRKSRDVMKLARVHLREIDEKITQLEGLKASLGTLVAHCHGNDAPDCPILDDLAGI